MATGEHETADREEAARPHPSRFLRWTLFLAGSLCVGLGAAGVFLPILPTVPFVLLAAACFARSSDRLHRRLLDSRLFGPSLRSWRARRCIPARARRVALACVAVAFGSSTALHLHRPPVALALAAAGLLVIALVARIPRCESPEPR